MTKIKKSEVNLIPDNKFMTIARVIVAVIMLAVMGILTTQSLLGTSDMQIVMEENTIDSVLFRVRQGWETVVYYSDDVFANAIWLVCGFIFISLLLPLIKKIPVWAQVTITATWTIVIGTIWIFSSNLSPTEDSYRVTQAALSAYNNDFEFLAESERYFRNYSYQLGYVFFNEFFVRIAHIFGPVENLLFLEVINVFLLAATYGALLLMNKHIFNDERVCAVTSLLFILAAQPIIFCSFLYGFIPGLAFAVYGLFFMVLYLKKDKIIYAPFSVICTALAVMIKQNYLIVLVAICCITFTAMFKRKKFVRDILFIAASIALALAVNPAVKSHYEKRANVDLGESIPITSWISMGLHEAGNAPGWYSPYYTIDIFAENNFNPDKASEKSMEQIKERIDYFKEHPQYRKEFFYKKFMSQWNETTYQSIWNNQIRNNYKPRTALAQWVCTDGEDTVKQYMDYFVQFIFAAVFVGLLACLKNKNFLSVTLPVVILGGVIYHILAEAKSQYAMPYFILMIGFGAYGVIMAYDYFGKKSENNKFAKLIFNHEYFSQKLSAVMTSKNDKKDSK